MSYYMRYISNDPRLFSLLDIESALQAVDPKYSIKITSTCLSVQAGQLKYGRALYACIEIVNVSQVQCEDIEELREEVEDGGEGENERVLHCLDTATCLLTMEVKWQSRSNEVTLQKIDPLWNWLTENRKGLAQADGEGYYEGQTLILDVAHATRRKKAGPPCPDCGKALRSELAKQCFECGADWH